MKRRAPLSLALFLALLAVLIALWPSHSQPRKLGEFGQRLAKARTRADGKQVAGLQQEGPEQWSLTVWNTSTGQPAWPAQPVSHPPGARPLAWSADGRWLAVGSKDEVALIDAATGRRTRLAANWLVREVRFSGDWLMARADGQVYLWQVSNGRLLRKLSQEALLSADLHYDQKVVATQSLDEPVRLYQMPEGRMLGQLPGGGAAIDLRFVRNGEWLVGGFRFRSGRQNDRVQIADWRQRKTLQNLSEPDLAGWDASADGSRLVTRSPQGMTLWNGQNGQPVQRHQRPGLLCEALSPDGKRMLALAENGRDVLVLDSDSAQLRAQLSQLAPPQAFGYFRNGGAEILQGSCCLWQLP